MSPISWEYHRKVVDRIHRSHQHLAIALMIVSCVLLFVSCQLWNVAKADDSIEWLVLEPTTPTLPGAVPPIFLPGEKLYKPSECIGAVVNGACYGGVIDTQPMRPVCHGVMIGGHCTGPIVNQ